ncbi:hypothetical protein GCM10023093_19660 [Nemorincola caseinilytica]|uniref:Uncharacterized protein n=1 Tax=Nemorincola caseinilytica TaxID=2054315 RepID=A0ABP8NIZ0_9BACT
MGNSNNGQQKKGPSKLPSKQIVFGNQSAGKKAGKAANSSVSTGKKGGVNMMRKLSGM